MGGAHDPVVQLEREVASLRARLKAAEADLAQAGDDIERLEDDIREHLPHYTVGEGDDTEDANAREVIEYAGAEIERLQAEVEQCKADHRRWRVMAEMVQQERDLLKQQRDQAIRNRQEMQGVVAELNKAMHKRDAADMDAQHATLCWGSLRAQLRMFVLEMERELRANDHKGGWYRDTNESLHKRVLDEAEELVQALVQLRDADPKADHRDLRRAVIKEAADVANFAMMIADNAAAGARD